MIDARELHVMNWLRDKSGREFPVLIISVTMPGNVGKWLINGMPEEQIDPIPITPEVLIEWFGFVLDEGVQSDTYIRHDPFYPVAIFNMDCTYAGRQMKKGDTTAGDLEWPPTVKYVHELQNTYFWQTRKRLDRKPKT